MSQLEYKLYWARSFLKKDDAATNSARSVWSLTERGQRMTDAECLDLPRRVRQRDARRRRDEDEDARADSEAGNDTESGEDISETATEDEAPDSELDWKEHLLQVLKAMPPAAFERLAQRLLRESGFTKVVVTGKTGDGGIDGQGVLRVNLVSFRVFFQCKRYSGAVSASQVRDFRGAMQGRGDKGLLITTGTFTSAAEQEATRDGAPAIDLVRGEELCELLKKFDLGVTTETVQRVTVSEDFFAGI